MANNCRFLVLARVPNLASRVLGRSVRHMSGDMEERFGHPALLAETFVDPSRFKGSCYLAAGCAPAGATRGFTRLGRARPAEDGPAATLVANAARALADLDEPAPWGLKPADPEPPGPGRLHSLLDHLRQVPKFRSAPPGGGGGGVRHSLASVLAVAAAARLAGALGPTAIAEFGDSGGVGVDPRALAGRRAGVQQFPAQAPGPVNEPSMPEPAACVSAPPRLELRSPTAPSAQGAAPPSPPGQFMGLNPGEEVPISL